MEKRRGVATSRGEEGGWKPGARAGYRSWLSPDPACSLAAGGAGQARRGPERPAALTLQMLTLCESPGAQTRSLSTPQGPQRARPLRDPAGSPASPAAAVPHWAPRRGLTAGWLLGGVSPWLPLRAPGEGPHREPQRRGVHRGRRRWGRRAGAPPAGGTSATGPGRGRAAAGGSCSPAVVGGGPAAHARCTEACFTSVTTGELGF